MIVISGTCPRCEELFNISEQLTESHRPTIDCPRCRHRYEAVVNKKIGILAFCGTKGEGMLALDLHVSKLNAGNGQT